MGNKDTDMKFQSSRILAAFLGLVMILGVTACNTMEGLGEDIEAVGEAIEEEAEES